MNSIQTLMQRARRYWFVDGIPEIGLGLLLLGYGAAFVASSIWQHTFALPIAILITGFGVPFFVRRLKERVTYPRTGYAAVPALSRRTQRMLMVALVLMGVMLCLIFPGSFVWFLATEGNPELSAGRESVLRLASGMMLLAFSGGMAAVLLWWGRVSRLPRFYGLAAVSLLVGGGLFLAALERGLYPWGDMVMLPRDLGIYASLMGLAAIGSGLLTFRAYLQQHPASMEEAR